MFLNSVLFCEGCYILHYTFLERKLLFFSIDKDMVFVIAFFENVHVLISLFSLHGF